MASENEQVETKALTELSVSATKPQGSVGRLLAQMGIGVFPILEVLKRRRTLRHAATEGTDT